MNPHLKLLSRQVRLLVLSHERAQAAQAIPEPRVERGVGGRVVAPELVDDVRLQDVVVGLEGADALVDGL